MMVHLLDGTYELFRHYYGRRRFEKGKDASFGAVTGVLHTVLEMIEKGATHIGVATITSSNPSGTVSGPATRRRRESSARSSRSSSRWKRPSPPWGSPSGP